MFWKKKNKPPVTKNDQNWLDENLSWLREVFTEEHFQSIKTVTLTKDFFNRNFDGSKEDAYFILNRIKVSSYKLKKRNFINSNFTTY